MSGQHRDTVRLHPDRSFELVDAALESTTDRRRRAILENFRAHLAAEWAGDLPAIMTTMADETRFITFTEDEPEGAGHTGRAATERFYRTMFDHGYTGTAEGTYSWIRPYIKGKETDIPPLDPRDRDHLIALYDGEIRYTDSQVSRLLEAIDRTLGLSNCLIIVLGDHGEEFGEHGSLEGHGWSLYEEVLHVPLIMRLPGNKARGRVVEEPVELRDLAPTVLDYLNIPSPDSFQGRSLTGTWEREEAPSTPSFVFGENARFDTLKRAVRGRRFKLIHTSSDTGTNTFGIPVEAGYELFDLQSDPGERKNIFSPANPYAEILNVEMIRRAGEYPRGETRDPTRVELSDEARDLLRSVGYIE